LAKGYFEGNISMPTNWQNALPQSYSLAGIQHATHVDLGCGNLPRNPLAAGKVIGVDISPQPAFQVESGTLEYKQVFPGSPLPFESNQIQSISAFDFLEHLPRSDRLPSGDYTNPFINMMNEIHRILKPGGVFIALTPCYPSPAAFTDPTHVNFITDTTHLYFSGPNFAKEKNYGFIGEFEIVEAAWSDWSGILWETYVIQNPATLVNPRVKLINFSRKFVRVFKFKVRKKLLGHSGESHFLWVLQKPETANRSMDV
jgi:SAM-dependent methyltransferase